MNTLVNTAQNSLIRALERSGLLAEDLLAGAIERLAEVLDAAGRRLQGAEQHLDRRRLAGAIGPEQPEDRAGLTLK